MGFSQLEIFKENKALLESMPPGFFTDERLDKASAAAENALRRFVFEKRLEGSTAHTIQGGYSAVDCIATRIKMHPERACKPIGEMLSAYHSLLTSGLDNLDTQSAQLLYEAFIGELVTLARNEEPGRSR